MRTARAFGSSEIPARFQGKTIRSLMIKVLGGDEEHEGFIDEDTGEEYPAHVDPRTDEQLLQEMEQHEDGAARLDAIYVARELIQKGYIRDGIRNRKNSFFVTGDVGRGKTCLACGTLVELMQQGQSGMFIECMDLVRTIQAAYGKKDEDGESESAARLELVRSIDVLVIDDLGDVERSKQFPEDTREIIHRLINYRHGALKTTIVTTNLDPAQLVFQLGRRIVDRLREMCISVEMCGNNLRD